MKTLEEYLKDAHEQGSTAHSFFVDVQPSIFSDQPPVVTIALSTGEFDFAVKGNELINMRTSPEDMVLPDTDDQHV